MGYQWRRILTPKERGVGMVTGVRNGRTPKSGPMQVSRDSPTKYVMVSTMGGMRPSSTRAITCISSFAKSVRCVAQTGLEVLNCSTWSDKPRCVYPTPEITTTI